MRGPRYTGLMLAMVAALGLFVMGCPEEGDDDDSAGNGDYTGPSQANINLNVFGTVGGEAYEHFVVYEGDEVASCGPQGSGDVVSFALESAASLTDTEGQLQLIPDGWLSDTELNPVQSLSALDDGGVFRVIIPELTESAFDWTDGTCFIYIQTESDSCYDNPDIPYCGNFSCGGGEDGQQELMVNGVGDSVRIAGSFNCYK